MAAEFRMILLVGAEVAREVVDVLADLFRGLFDLERAKSLEDGLEVGEEGGRGDDDDAVFPAGALDEVLGVLFDSADFIDEQVVVNRFRGDKHKGEVERPFFRADVFRGFLDSELQVVHERLLEALALDRIGRLDEAIIILEGEFRVDRDDLVLHPDNRVDDLAVVKAVLRLVAPGREDILQDGLEVILADCAALLRVFQEVLKPLKLAGEVEDLLVRFVEFCEPFGDIFDNLGALAELGLHRLVDRAARLVEAGLEALKVLVEHEERLGIVSRFLQLPEFLA